MNHRSDYGSFPSPCYILDEELLRKNLALIAQVKEDAGINIILAFKAFALWNSFSIVREYIGYSTASSPAEARLAFEQMGAKAHTYCPAYKEEEFDTIMECSSHITFNSSAQFDRFYPLTLEYGTEISCGLRINPEFSDVETDLYNPCAPGSRLGITAEKLQGSLPCGVEGLHFHTLCESSSYDLERTLQQVEQKFGHLFSQIRWINMGGGHLITKQGYDTDHLIRLMQAFKGRYPHLEVILEPGSAFAWQTGVLRSTILDIVENKGITTALLDVSFACHMPDCLEMPYQPSIVGAEIGAIEGKYIYRMGGNSCLSGDFIGDWSFDAPLKIGQSIVFEDMIHYTIVKTTMFNGVSHPAIGCLTKEGKTEIWRTFGYEDYKTRNGSFC